MPYLEMKKNDVDTDNLENSIEMPNVEGMTLEEAKKILKEIGLEIEIEGEEKNESIIKEQLPKKGIKTGIGTKVTLYVE